MDDRLLILLREALLNTFLSLSLPSNTLFCSYSTSNCFSVYPGSFLLPFIVLLMFYWQPACFVLPPSHTLFCLERYNWKLLNFPEFQFKVLSIPLFQHLISTFLNTKGSSLYAGFSPLFITIRVRNSLRMVSVGSPYMSTSTYVPIFLSDKNCPEKT